MDTTPDQPPEETWDDIPEDIMTLTTDEIQTRTRLIDNDIKVCLVSNLVFSYRLTVSCLGDEIRDNEATARTECNEGED